MKKKRAPKTVQQPRHDLTESPTFTVGVPAVNQNQFVNYQDPPTNTSLDDNFVCEVSGMVSESDCPLSGIWVLNLPTRPTQTGSALSELIQTNGVMCTEIVDGDWFIDADCSSRVPGFLAANFGDRTNYLAAVAVFGDSSGCPNPPPNGIVVGPFAWNAKGSEGCPARAIKKRAAAAAAATSNTASQLRVVPTMDGDWLHYAINLEKRVTDATCPRPGVNSILLLDPDGSDPLMADEIAVAAQVHWRPSPTRELVIRDPQGISDCRIRDSIGSRRPLMRFQGLPKFSLVLWQPTIDRPVVVTSQCRTNPLELSLDPGREILLELNDNNQSLLDNEGTMDLWVKVPGLPG